MASYGCYIVSGSGYTKMVGEYLPREWSYSSKVKASGGAYDYEFFYSCPSSSYWKISYIAQNVGINPTATRTAYNGSGVKNTAGTDYGTIYECEFVTLTLSAGVGGTVTNSIGSIIAGVEAVSIKATPSAGYGFLQWSDGDSRASRSYTPGWDVSLSASFYKLPFSITVVSGGNGTVSPNGTVSIANGSAMTLTGTPSARYSFKHWIALPPGDGYTSTVNPWTYTPSVNRNWTGVFEQIQWVVDVVSRGEGNAIVGTSGQETSGYFGNGDTVKVRAIPFDSRLTAFSHWEGTGGTWKSDDIIYEFIMAGSVDWHLIAVFKEKTYDLTVATQNFKEEEIGVWGYASMNPNKVVQTTTNSVLSITTATYWATNPVVLTAIPKEHGIFVEWVDSDGVHYEEEQLLLSFTDYNAMTYTAYFEQSELYTIDLSPNGTDGAGNKLSIKSHQGMGTGADAAKYYGGTTVFEAIPAIGKRLYSWNVTDMTTLTREMVGFGNTLSRNVNKNTIVIATFEANQYDVKCSVHVDSIGHGTVSKSGPEVFYYNSSVTFSASPVEGGTDVFKGWYSSENVLLDTNPVVTLTVTGDLDYRAKFGNTATVSVNHGDGVPGTSTVSITTPEGSGTTGIPFTFGDTVSLSAQVQALYSFTGWFNSATNVIHPSYGKNHSFVAASRISLYALIVSNPVAFYVKMTNEVNGFGQLTMLTEEGELLNESSDWYNAAQDIFGRYVETILQPLDLNNNKYYRFYSVDTVSISSAGAISGSIFKQFVSIPRVLVASKWEDDSSTPISKNTQNSVTLSANCTLKATFYSSEPTTMSLAYVTDNDGSMGQIGFNVSGVGAELTGSVIRSEFTQGTELYIVAMPKNGYKFIGWYETVDGAVMISDSYEYLIEVTTEPKTYYAKFGQEANAIYEWEGDGVYKRMRWESKRFINQVPFCPSAMRVEAEGYPVFVKVKMSSSPDPVIPATIPAEIANQDGRRLMLTRPEKYISIVVTSVYPVNSVAVSTSMIGLR